MNSLRILALITFFCVGGIASADGIVTYSKFEQKSSPSKLFNTPYMSISAGYAHSRNIKSFEVIAVSQETLDNTFIYGLSLGMHITKPFRVEAELQYKPKYYFCASANKREERGDFDHIAGFVNGFYEFPIKKEYVKLIATAGIGASRNKFFDFEYHGGSDDYTAPARSYTDLAWQAGIGVGFMLNEYSNLDVFFKYIDRGVIKRPGNMIDKSDKEPMPFSTKEQTRKMQDVLMLVSFRIKI